MTEMRGRGEMPFLDHLEEMRWRIIWSLVALVVGAVIGFFVVQNLDVLELLKRPITPFLPGDKLFITRPTDAFMITMKLALMVGVVLAAPVILWQGWAFLSPALYEREKRFIIPAAFAGLVLFAIGVCLAYLWVLPAALRILFSFQQPDLEPIITANEYFGFAAQLVLAFGVMFELPLVIILLSAFGLVNPRFFAKNRAYALVVAAVIAAFLTPPDVLSLLFMLFPLVVLYESGVAIGRIVWKRRRTPKIGAAAVLLLLAALPSGLHGQEGRRVLRPVKDTTRVVRPEPGVRDSLRGPTDRSGTALDTATARKLGLPTAPSRLLPQADSVMRALLGLVGYRVTRYAADSVVLHAETQEVELLGEALVVQDDATLEADTIRFEQAKSRLLARGSPTLFQAGTVLVGDTMRYDTDKRRGFIVGALTNFRQAGVEWFMRGGLSIDSASVRLYGGHSDITSCDLPDPHYHFAAGSVKWVTNTLLVARPAVLYVRDIPVLWLPFIFQDMRPGRRSGILIPRFGINDIVRPNGGYSRHISNVGYYIAINDYVDFRTSLDWYSGISVTLNGEMRYRWRDRFVGGGVSLSRIFESGRDGGPGGRSLRLRWGHQQNFDQRTRLSASVDYATSARVLERNAVDPFLATATLGSNINFSKRFDWGTLTVGGSRRQDLTNGSVTQTLPVISLSPVPIDITDGITWSPSFTVTNNRAFGQRTSTVPLPPMPGDTVIPLDTLLAQSRQTDVRISTPLRIGRWNWNNSFSIRDKISEARGTQTIVDPDNPADTLTQFFGIDFTTAVDWNTSINLPALFPSSWKLQPSLGIQNSTPGPFLLRNRNTGGRFVRQGKRLSLGATLTPTFFGFFPGVGPIARIRHAVTPLVQWGYSPEAAVPEEYARALDPSGTRLQRLSPAQHRVSIGLTQTFEGKFAPPPGDTADGRNARKIKLLSLQTSSIVYDFEQAKEPGRTGWQTATLSNQFSSDLLPGFSLSTTHDLWECPDQLPCVGTDSARFSPFLSRVSARFSISESTIRGIVGLLTGHHEPPDAPEPDDPTDTELTPQEAGLIRDVPGDPFHDFDRRSRRPRGARRPFTASISYDDTRRRGPVLPAGTIASPANRTLGLGLAFDPTEHWSVSWTTQYNLTTNEFGHHVVRLERDLHRWRATFQFLKSPNGNFAFNFFISLMDQPDIQFNYDQRTVQR
ncbi:MAG: twin-arginine translocase subunit TatC [Gemmatimonadetes bacterium]|nr:twin-arginine translocase subunit TatC [Gemmatimonadota bacterium]